MYILGIETSCDESATAIYDSVSGCVLGEKIYSQIETHNRFGGIVPEVASREHLKFLPALVDQTLKEAGLSSFPDAIAVTHGPGLMGALLVGVSYAKAMGVVYGCPVIPINHLEGHLLSPGIMQPLQLPCVTLLVSGGHTLLVAVDAVGQYRLLGQSLDDAAGECFDKCARLLGLPYPGGPVIAKMAEQGDPKRFDLPRPMLHKKNLHFSFSGLKTALMYKVRGTDIQQQDQQWKNDLAASLQAAIVDVLVKKSLRACVEEQVSHLWVAGGVAANLYLRERMIAQASEHDVSVCFAAGQHCTDNAAMIAYAAWQHIEHGLVKKDRLWDAQSRCPLV
ncbi:MAG: tRNA (adenosine(37)-N6)-threonylcarbamoyltransferase complex transferase subunit TsaD [Mariprofundaceae bacterium]|nr:tRNA (adenosine(37)-N6)-threonylcarbamoyltransferase complex transferase subunit TsaD [Mariprofundaceae bacterium]